jgi:hypothetical protein
VVFVLRALACSAPAWDRLASLAGMLDLAAGATERVPSETGSPRR